MSSTRDSQPSPSSAHPPRYQFPHPTTFSPIPYHTDTTLTHFVSTIIPLTRTTRAIPISLPVFSTGTSNDADGMELDVVAQVVQLQIVQAEVRSDGLLLYLAQASYEPGTSPLSTWVPLRAYQTREETESEGPNTRESPLEVFARCVPSRYSLISSAYIACDITQANRPKTRKKGWAR